MLDSKIHLNQIYGDMTEIIGIKTNFLFQSGASSVRRRQEGPAGDFGVKIEGIFGRRCTLKHLSLSRMCRY